MLLAFWMFLHILIPLQKCKLGQLTVVGWILSSSITLTVLRLA
jgi:hypothetical protein